MRVMAGSMWPGVRGHGGAAASAAAVCDVRKD